QPCTARALGESEQLVLPAARVRPALEARRRTSQDDDGALRARAHDGHLARVVARRLALLVARLVLLVDDDGAEVAERREDGRAGADGDALLAAAEGEPGVVPLAVGEGAVQHGDPVPEDGAEAVDRLRGEGDLGD